MSSRTPRPRPPSPTRSNPVTPDRRHFARRGSVSLHHAASLSSLHTRSASAVVFNHDLQRPTQGRVKAKVSALVQRAELSQSSSSPRVVRVPSVPSSAEPNGSNSPPPVLYPITTATAAANPHRYATTRPSPPSGGRHHYLPFSHSPDIVTKPVIKVAVAKVAPSPPMISPPVSTLSFSSQSSVSRSSPTDSPPDSRASAQTFSSQADELDTSPLEGLSLLNGQSHPRDHQVRAEAKSNRKIADLEITNRSLMTINASLEAIKHRQAKEIRDLRRKLRETRFTLPPPPHHAVKSTTADHSDTDLDDHDDEPSDGEETDKAYRRVKVMIENLLESGRKALQSKAEDHQEGGNKVLSPYDVRSWHSSSATDDTVILANGLNAFRDDAHAADGVDPDKAPSSTLIRPPAYPYDSESEAVVASHLIPPIQITTSS